MKLWRLFPIVMFVAVIAAATVGVAALQNISSDHNFAAEGEENAKSCDEIEVEYGGDDGDVDRVKLSYPPGGQQSERMRRRVCPRRDPRRQPRHHFHLRPGAA